MPIRYFGHRTVEFGRPLWEIVLNLRNFGKGRYVVRSIIEKQHPAPSFYKILSVHPHVVEYPENFKGNILAELVYRGRRKPEPIDIGEDAGISGFRLIPKEDEPALLQRLAEYEANPDPTIILPRTVPLPPLWKIILGKERGVRPEDVPEIPMLYKEIDPFNGPPKRVAEEGEKPTFLDGPGNFTPLYREFYDNVIWSREEARAKYCNKIPEPDFIYVDKKLEPVDISEKIKEKAFSGKQ